MLQFKVSGHHFDLDKLSLEDRISCHYKPEGLKPSVYIIKSAKLNLT